MKLKRIRNYLKDDQGDEMIVTTSRGMREDLVQLAKKVARELKVDYLDRRDVSLVRLLKEHGRVLVASQEGLSLESSNGSRLHFHPDTAMLRIKAPRDPLVELVGQSSKTVLDCTMGLASDSIVLAAAGHRVTALESELLPYTIVSRGLAMFETGNAQVDATMRSIQTVCSDSLPFLQQLPDRSVDVVYFDPMFSEAIAESENLNGLTALANPSRLTVNLLNEAKRVAREKVILKAHFRDRTFEELGFIRYVRPYQKFHYGEILVQ